MDGNNEQVYNYFQNPDVCYTWTLDKVVKFVSLLLHYFEF